MERNNEIVSAESITELADELKDHKAGSVLLTSRASRRIVKECLEARGVFIPVLAHEEVTKIHAVENLGYVGRAYEKSEDAAMVM
jgi:flagellar biosynthesis component FlhA